MRISKCACVLASAIVMAAGSVAQAVAVSLNSVNAVAFMNVFDIGPGPNGSGGPYMFGSPWGVADLKAEFSGSDIILKAAPIATTDSYWYTNGTGGPGATGNKYMDANLYVENDALLGQTVEFSGNVVSNTFVSGYTSTAFIKVFDGSYGLLASQTASLAATGPFNLSLDTSAVAGGVHVQYGFTTNGRNVWTSDVDAQGFVQVAPVPEPASLLALGAAATLMGRRRR